VVRMDIIQISEFLKSITERDVNLLDQEVTDGTGWKTYCNGQIIRPTVLNDQITGICLDHYAEYSVEVRVQDNQISSTCNCDNHGTICRHVVALLYSWINDGEAFRNIGQSIKELQTKNKEELIEVITKILKRNPQSIFLLGGSDPLDEELDDIEGMFN
jgi:hypothetical protein